MKNIKEFINEASQIAQMGRAKILNKKLDSPNKSTDNVIFDAMGNTLDVNDIVLLQYDDFIRFGVVIGFEKNSYYTGVKIHHDMGEEEKLGKQLIKINPKMF